MVVLMGQSEVQYRKVDGPGKQCLSFGTGDELELVSVLSVDGAGDVVSVFMGQSGCSHTAPILYGV